ncbi:uncharacterized protein BX663DRAFT_491277 [Cokeromyces recurvatus]|uniref:uncharacterized protein n=1 Tax=Cokeromyces recurvatus TaxID=90255 RepID=UPI00221F7B1E|nr:uncharacterized protein BX663DRAFT_491277 [Cokeromyces recurvatus]KAI7907554.1 hypothetical protein BX663DRAFT_491277 [Cokeromyces recurvatus]
MSSPETKKRKIDYKCQYCDKSYKKPSKLTEHERSHTGERPFICSYLGCNKSYMRNSHLKVHERSHANIKDFVCSFENCDKAYGTKQHLQRHEKTHTSPLIKCEYPGCTAEFSKRFQLRWHRASHEKGTYICNVCQNAFDSLPALEKHKNRVHENPIIYNCTTCDQSFLKWSELRKHVQVEHPAVCTICNKTYTRPSYLRQHIKDKHTDPIKCTWFGCDSILKNRRSYRFHLAFVHEQYVKYKCDSCGKGFPYKSVYERHKKSHEPKPKSTSSRPKRSLAEILTGYNYYSKNGFRYKCPFEHCQFKFTNTYLLRRHLEGKHHENDVKAFERSQLENTEQSENTATTNTTTTTTTTVN